MNTLVGRFAMMVPMLALGGIPGREEGGAGDGGHVPGDTPLFVVLLIGVIVIVGALTFFPALALGPIVEHLLMNAGRAFCMASSPRRPLFDPAIVRARRGRRVRASSTRATWCGTR